MSKRHFLDFEQPVAELETKIEELRYVQSESAVDISEEISRLQKKSNTLTKDIYAKLSAWQISQVARHPQRPYALEFWHEDDDTDRNEPLLGMPSHSDWVLMSTILDRSLMRNFLLQQAMLEANGPGSGVRCRFVEVFYNQGNTTLDYADYRGVYLLMEKVSRGKERVDIAKLNDSMSDPALIDGGFVFKNDKPPYNYRINAASVAAVPGSSRDYDIFDPEPVVPAHANALVAWLNRMTAALAAPDFANPASPNYYGRWLDERSFIDRALWYELCKEVDAFTFSYYFSKDRGGPMKAFPFWDVDRSLGNTNYASSNATFGMKWWAAGANYTYYTRLHQDPEFNDRYWNRWTALRRSHFSREKLFERIESAYALLADGSRADIGNASTAATMAIQAPAARHYRKYPVLGAGTINAGSVGQTTRTTWRQEVDAMKAWIAERLEWIDGAPDTINATTLADRLRPFERRHMDVSDIAYVDNREAVVGQRRGCIVEETGDHAHRD